MLPKEVENLQNAVLGVEGVRSVEIRKTSIEDIAKSDFSLPPYGDLPIGALRRTNGGYENELLISINFTINRDENGLRALEFLAWWVRDHARSGRAMQLRALALPPLKEQFGRTLKFSVDYFYADDRCDMGALLAVIDELASSLTEARRIYLD